MNKLYRYLLLTVITASLVASCGIGKKSSTPVYIDPLLNKTDNELTPTEKYIKNYRDIAISEMERTGVPASITLAQGILESGNGNSFLTKQANNHFGIKCSGWAGDEIYMDDDKENECFRKYKSAAESYADHSDFLRSNPRYESLFALEKTDYKAWAKGLKEAGYATRRNYAELLIDIIQKNDLDMYDIKAIYKQPASDKNPGAGQSFKYNGITAYEVKKGETYQSIAAKFKMDVPTLLSYNDLDSEIPLLAGAILYLKPKKTKAKESYHIVKETDNIYKISQEYGIKLASLLQFNMLNDGDEPAVGEILYLKNSRKEPPELRVIIETKPEEQINELEDLVKENDNELITIEPDTELTKAPELNETGYEEVTPTNKPEITPAKGNEVINTEKKVEDILKEADNENPYKDIAETKPVVKETKTVKTTPATQVDFHFVQKSETLYSISKKYHVTVADLQKWNKLSGNNIDVGDTLIIKTQTNKPAPEVSIKPVSSNAVVTEPAEMGQGGDTLFHIVKPEETLYTISKEYETTIIDLISKNKLDKYELEPGQRLIIKFPEKPVYSSLTKPTGNNQDPFINPTLSTKPKSSTITTQPGRTATKNQSYHTVTKGETLYSISKKYNTTVTRLKQLNNLTSNNIDIGQKLVVEGTVSNVTTHAAPIKRINNNSNQKFHVVQVDETLFSIARKYNITVQRLKELNNLQDNIINVGQKLIVE